MNETKPQGVGGDTWRDIVLFVVTLGCIVLVGAVFLPFMPSIIWAVALAVVLRTPTRWLRKRIGKPGLAAGIELFLVIVLVLLPLSLLVRQLGSQLVQAAALVQSGQAQDWVLDTLQKFPRVNEWVEQAVNTTNLRQAAQSVGGFIAPRLQHFLSASVASVTKIALMLFTLFFLFRDGEDAEKLFRGLLPMDAKAADRLIERLRDTISATVQGSLSIAAIQGCLGGVMFQILGVPSALIWTLLMAALATIPSLGTFLVWAPVAAYLAMTDHWIKSIILVAWGVLVIGTVDNLLYPTLVGSKLQLHTVPVLFAVLGGVAMFGVTGIILGPLLLALTVQLIRFWTAGRQASTGAGNASENQNASAVDPSRV